MARTSWPRSSGTCLPVSQRTETSTRMMRARRAATRWGRLERSIGVVRFLSLGLSGVREGARALDAGGRGGGGDGEAALDVEVAEGGDGGAAAPVHREAVGLEQTDGFFVGDVVQG